MNDDELWARIRRIYAAVDATVETEFSRLKPKVIGTKKTIGFMQDFRGGLDDDQLTNLAMSAIYNVAHLRDHLKRWGKKHQKTVAEVDDTVRASQSLSLIVDLSNADKHPPERRRDFSGLGPRLANINRVLRMTVAGNSGMALTLNQDGTPRVIGQGSSGAVIVADVLTSDGTKIAELDEIIRQAVEDWEKLLTAWGANAQS